MKNELVRQDNRITTARYELSTIEKRVMYVIIRQIMKQFVLQENGQRDLFNDLVVKMKSSEILKNMKETNPSRVKKALKSLRLRSFEYDNGLPEDHPDHHWFEVGFINYGEWEKGGFIEVQVSKKILPFFVELTRNFTEYSLVVAISLKSKWSQRLYELCSKWRSAGGFQIEISTLKDMFDLKEQYAKYASFRKRVLDVAHKELKELYEKGGCDLYFEYSEQKEGRSVEQLRFKVISNNDKVELSTEDLDYIVRTQLHDIFDTKNKPKNKEFIGRTMTELRLNPDKLKHCYKRLESIKTMPKADHGRYMRFIINEDYLN
jgi:plasmid replication initiation protein